MNKTYKISIELELEDERSALALLDFVKRGTLTKAVSGVVILVEDSSSKESSVVEYWQVVEGKKQRVE